MTIEARVRELHDRAVAELIEAHVPKKDEPLVLAVRYFPEEPFDVYLLEVLADFPGGDDDELLTSELEPSEQLRILGMLYVTIGSPAQLRAAATRDDDIVADIKTGTVVFSDGSEEANALRALLGV